MIGWGPPGQGFLGFAVAVLILAAGFFFGLTVDGLVASVDFSLDFLGPAFFLVAVTLDCVGSSVTG